MSRNASAILIETDVLQTFSVRIGRNHLVRIHCESCGADDDLTDLNTAVATKGIPGSELIERIANGSIHSLPHRNRTFADLPGVPKKRQLDLEDRNYEAEHLDLIRQKRGWFQ